MNRVIAFIKRHPLVVFFAISLGTFYGGALSLAYVPEALWFLFIWGTALGGLFVVAITEGWVGVKNWASRIVRWRVGVIWYLVALGLTPLIRLAAYGLNLALGAPAPPANAWNMWSEVPGEFIFIFLTIAIGEEPGFRGYALPKLLERHSPLSASLILGVMRILWHVPLVLALGDSPWVFVDVLAGDIIITWMFLHTRGSVLMAMLMHATLNATGVVFGPMFGGAFAEQQGMLLAIAFAVTAALIVVITGPNLTLRRPLTAVPTTQPMTVD